MTPRLAPRVVPPNPDSLNETGRTKWTLLLRDESDHTRPVYVDTEEDVALLLTVWECDGDIDDVEAYAYRLARLDRGRTRPAQ